MCTKYILVLYAVPKYKYGGDHSVGLIAPISDLDTLIGREVE